MKTTRRKSYLVACFGGLLVSTYVLFIMATLILKKQRELTENLERFHVPSSHNKMTIPDLHEKLHTIGITKRTKNVGDTSNLLQGEKSDSVKTEDHKEISQLSHAYEYDKTYNATSKQVQNETVVHIITYPDRNQSHFAVFGISTPGYEDYFYAFSAPLAVRSWKRIGYDCIIFIVGDINEWMSRDTLKHILSELMLLKPAIVFIKNKPENDILLSQACRLFAANFFSWDQPQNTYIITTDVDLWPLSSALFDMPQGRKIKSLNSECCGSFDHGSHIYKLLPLGNIVADVYTWKQIINVHGFYPKTGSEIIDYFFRVFGPLALERTRKEEYIGWYMDQRMISMRLSEWMDKYGGSNVEFVPRDPGRDRIDVNYWVPYSLYGKNDIHILSGAHKPGVWEKIRPLIKLMYSKDEEYEIVEYREMFMKLYISTRKNS